MRRICVSKNEGDGCAAETEPEVDGLIMHVLTEKVSVGEEGQDQATWRGLVRSVKVGQDEEEVKC